MVSPVSKPQWCQCSEISLHPFLGDVREGILGNVGQNRAEALWVFLQLIFEGEGEKKIQTRQRNVLVLTGQR